MGAAAPLYGEGLSMKALLRRMFNLFSFAGYMLGHLPARDGLVLWFGSFPSKGVPHGGRVKLAHFAARFAVDARRFNAAYAVSSARPRDDEALLAFCKTKKIPFVLNQNGVAYPAWAGKDYERINAPMRRLLRGADHVVYQSRFCKDAADRFLGVCTCPWTVVYNSVDVVAFAPSRRDADGTVRLLAMGSHEQDYRVLRAVEVLAALRSRGIDARLTVAGRLVFHDAKERVLSAAAALGVSDALALSGPYTQEQAPSLYQAADILLHLKYNDPCPTVPIEAMACGVPVVGSVSGGMPELVAEDSGVLLPVPQRWDEQFVPEAVAIADAVVRVSADLRKYSTAARVRAVSLFSKEAWLAAHEDIFAKFKRNGHA
jgi:glycosyltransferase involved in cell wall biosynthesis